eukprot:10913003-Lingulodinium_polyedra.AAC.1
MCPWAGRCHGSEEMRWSRCRSCCPAHTIVATCRSRARALTTLAVILDVHRAFALVNTDVR